MNTQNILGSSENHRSILIIARRFYESMMYKLPSAKADMRLGRSISWAAFAGRRATLLISRMAKSIRRTSRIVEQLNGLN